MKKVPVRIEQRKILADIITPVSIYLKVRDIYPNSVLLESSDYHTSENSYSFICLNPVASFIVERGKSIQHYPDGTEVLNDLDDVKSFNKHFNEFFCSFQQAEESTSVPVNGLFGYTSYDAVQYFETLKFKRAANREYEIPDVRYKVQDARNKMPIHTTLKIYSILRQEVRTLVDEAKEAGSYVATWDGRNHGGFEVASGVYFYRFQSGNFTATRRMVLMK